MGTILLANSPAAISSLIGFAVAGVWCDPFLYERFGEFSELLPFLRFCQPIVHFLLGKLSAARHMNSNAANCSCEFMRIP